MDMIDNQLF